MAVVLPMSGVQQYFCTMTMAFSEKPDGCLLDEEEDCCKRESRTEKETPDCMVSAKMIPDADLTAPFEVPELDTEGFFQEVVITGVPAAKHLESISAESHRGPPDMSRIYAEQRRLLI